MRVLNRKTADELALHDVAGTIGSAAAIDWGCVFGADFAFNLRAMPGRRITTRGLL
jgi:hypothetical protein